MPRRKKIPLNPFQRHSRCMSPDGADIVREEEALEAEFSDLLFSFTPNIPRMPAAFTIKFKCNCKISRGDTIVIKMTGFKGGASGVFQLEERKDDDADPSIPFRNMFHAYWHSDQEKKGTPSPMSVTLMCRHAIEPETVVVFGIPESVRIGVPDKLSMSSQKVKIGATLRHNNTNNGKIPFVPMQLASEVPKKRTVEEQIGEVATRLQQQFDEARFTDPDTEQQMALEVTDAELDQIWAAARQTSDLKLGVAFEMLDSAVFKNYASIAPLWRTVHATFHTASKRRIPLQLQRELATNIGVKMGCIAVLEDALHTIFCSKMHSPGSSFNELPRGSILALRLFTCEQSDLARIFAACNVNNPPCIYREINSALRCGDPELVQRWTWTIAALSTCCQKLTQISSDLVPVLYRGVKDLPADAITHLQTLKKDAFYVFPTFTTWVSNPVPLRMAGGAGGAGGSNGLASSVSIAGGGAAASAVLGAPPAPDDPASLLPPTLPEAGVLYEVHGPVHGVELCDISQYPQDAKWMLPMFSAFSVVSVTTHSDRNNLVHVVLRMTGSLGGALRDDRFPQEDHNLFCPKPHRMTVNPLWFDALMSSQLANAIYTHSKLTALRRMHPQHSQALHLLDRYAEVHVASQARAAIEGTTAAAAAAAAGAATSAAGGGASAGGGAAAGTSTGPAAAAIPGGLTGADLCVRWQQQVIDTPAAAGGGASSGSPSSSTRPGSASQSAAAADIVVAQSWDVVPKKHMIVLEMALLKRTATQTKFTFTVDNQREPVEVELANWTADLGRGPRNIRRIVGKGQTHPFQSF